MDEQTNSKIRRLLQNDYAVVATVAAVVMGFTTWVVIPIQKLQVQIALVQEQLIPIKDLSTATAVMQADIENLEKQESVTQTKLESHIEKTK